MIEQTASDASPLKLNSRSSIIHFLGWMVGCGVVLAIYRANTTPENSTLLESLRQLGMGLAYGTALSGLVLFLWRWRTLSGPLPTQPGHWLLVFAGLGLLVDLATSAPFVLAQRLGMELTFPTWLCQQLAAWGTATLVGLVVLVRLRGASREWVTAAGLIVAALGLNAAADIASLIGRSLSAGTWPWYLPAWAHLAASPLALPAVWGAELADRFRGLPRDWLHYVGILAITVLGLVDFASQLVFLYRS